ncbi:NAD(P)/FAD-dependent oxidoreductase [Anaeromyxobacter terrae]|uniref:NAD(P)/FAD-dependent oxidoreductase n=1 Tax=Anaeromyxobacter terrae TaxID=2925406 RepID=UPI001F5653EB|nr:FAD/NAD(P)-binding oxidoreductase [Anaeromyxobacter sp. SG22]
MSASVLVLGGGVGGNVAATELRRLLPPEHSITLVERSEDFVLGASLLWIAVGERRPAEVTRRIATLSARGVEVVRGEIERIDSSRRQVTVAGRELAADHLVVALGAELDASGVPGLAASGHSLYELEGAVSLRDALERFTRGRFVVLTAAPAYKCPAAPYEAAMLVEWHLRRRGVRDATTLELFAAEPAPMGVAGPAVSAAVRDLLGAKGIAYHPAHQVVRADPAARQLEFQDGTTAGYDLLAYVAPHRAPRVVREAGLTGESGWIPVDRATLRTRFERVWAVGDVTGIPLSLGKPLPKAGTFASGEAEVVARIIAREITGQGDAGPYAAIGECWVETGDGLAAFGKGDFFAEPAPAVTLQPPGAVAHRAKEAWERDWLARWS